MAVCTSCGTEFEGEGELCPDCEGTEGEMEEEGTADAE